MRASTIGHQHHPIRAARQPYGVSDKDNRLFTARRYPEAHALKSSAPQAFIDSRFFGAATLAHMEPLYEAKYWADTAVPRLADTSDGALAIAQHRVVDLQLQNNPYFRQEDHDHFARGMRKAGVLH